MKIIPLLLAALLLLTGCYEEHHYTRREAVYSGQAAHGRATHHDDVEYAERGYH